MIQLGKKIRKYREWLEISQEYMAMQLGITQSTYSKIERGQIDIPHDRIQQLAALFGLPADEFLLLEVNQLPLNQGNLKVHVAEIRPQLQNMYQNKIQELEYEITDLKKQLEALNQLKENNVPS